MATAHTPEASGEEFHSRVQRLGGHLAAMVMPNIGAFIAWGLITALFIPTGWLPDKRFGALVDPTINVLLPVLIGYTGGRMVHGQRGAVVGAVATIGVVVGAGIPMFLGAMIMGPLAAYVLKLVDGFIQDKTSAGFEMLVDNFTAGIIGGAAAVFGTWAVGPVVKHVTEYAGNGVELLIHHHLLPLASVLIEPAKVLFLNNAINHGVLGPLGVAESVEHGKSILFMLESNPGPGFGILPAYLLFGPKRLRPSVPGRDGHPVPRRHPRDLLPVHPDEAAADPGLDGRWRRGHRHLHDHPCRPGRHPFARQHLRLRRRDPQGQLLRNFLGILVAAAVSFAVGSILLGFGRFAEPRHVGRHADHSEDYRMIDTGLVPEPEPAQAPARAPAPAPARTAGPRADWRA